MDDIFGSPFGEDLSGWALPEGFRPHMETVELMRGFAGSGRLMDQEVYELAAYLNEDREARHAWPGSPLFKHLHQMFSADGDSESNYAYLGRVLDELDRQCAKVAEPLPEEAGLPEAAVKVETLLLPRINRKVSIAAEGSRVSFEADLNSHSCTCPGWYGNRGSFEDGDLRLCCAHMAAAFTEALQEESNEHPRVLVEFLAERARRGRGTDTKAQWKLFKIRMRPTLVSFRRDAPCNVYAFDTSMRLKRFVFHSGEKRWSFGQAPGNHGYLSQFLAKAGESSSLAR